MLQRINRPAKNESIFLKEIIILSQLAMTQGATEMFWVPRPTHRHHTFLHTIYTHNQCYPLL